MVDPFELTKFNENSKARAIVNGTNIAFPAVIRKIIDNDFVIVEKLYSFTPTKILLGCRYVTPCSALIEIDAKPTVGDNVLVISLQHLDGDMLRSQEPVPVTEFNGYGYLSCVAIPFGLRKGNAATTVTVDTEKVAVVTDKPVSITAESVAIQGTAKHAVYWEDLNAALEKFRTELNAFTSSLLIEGDATGSFTGTFPASIDVSAAKAADVTIGD